MHEREIERIEGLLEPDFTVLEFGAGGSTHWLSERVAAVLSIGDRSEESGAQLLNFDFIDIAVSRGRS